MTSTIDSTTSASTGAYTAIIIDASNNIHIVYRDATNTDLRYMTKLNGGSWSASQGVDTGTASYGQYASMSLGSDGLLHIVEYDTANAGDIRYIYGSSGSWTKATISGGATANNNGKWATIKAE